MSNIRFYPTCEFFEPCSQEIIDQVSVKNNKLTFGVLSVLISLVGVIAYFYVEEETRKLIVGVLGIILIISLFKFLDDSVKLKINSEGIHEKGTTVHYWNEIVKTEIKEVKHERRVEDNYHTSSYYLIIQKNNETDEITEISLFGLNKNYKEISHYIELFKNQFDQKELKIY